MSLREWTGWRVTAAWVLWFVLACGGAVVAVVTYARAHAPPEPSTTGHAAGPVIGPTYNIALNGWLVLGALLGPPVVLTAAWVWQRRRWRATT